DRDDLANDFSSFELSPTSSTTTRRAIRWPRGSRRTCRGRPSAAPASGRRRHSGPTRNIRGGGPRAVRGAGRGLRAGRRRVPRRGVAPAWPWHRGACISLLLLRVEFHPDRGTERCVTDPFEHGRHLPLLDLA